MFGTFNPPTNAHVQMGITAKKVLGDECKIIYVPTNDVYIRDRKHYKEGSVMRGRTRVTLLAEAVYPYDFTVSSVEVDGEVDGKTFNTLEYLGDRDSVLCVGTDNIHKIKKWYRHEDLLAKYRLLIFDRDGYAKSPSDILGPEVRWEIAHLDKSCNGLSATLVRDLYIKGELEKVKDLVPLNVFKYLSENRDIYF